MVGDWFSELQAELTEIAEGRPHFSFFFGYWWIAFFLFFVSEPLFPSYSLFLPLFPYF